MDDWRTILLLLAGGQGLLLSIALLSKFRNPNKSTVFLGIIIFVFAIEILLDFAIKIEYTAKPNFPFWNFGSYLLLPPALHFFILSNTDANFRFKKKNLILFFPAIAEILIKFSHWTLINISGKPYDLMGNQLFFVFAEIVPVVWCVLVLIFSWIRIKKAAKLVKHPYHKTKLFIFLSYFFLIILFWILLVFTSYKVFNYVEILLITLLFVLGYIGYFKPSFFETPKAFTNNSLNLFPNYSDEDELLRLKNSMEQEKLYLNNDLSLKIVAEKLKLPKRYVSYLINTYYNTNFHNFINSYRVKEVIKRIENPKHKHKTLLALAFESGFNSKSTFNQVFKTHTGKSPSKFLNK